MYVLSKKELEALQAESALAQVKRAIKSQDLTKAVQIAGTAQPMPVLPQRAPPTVMNRWEIEEGVKRDAELEAARIARTQPQPQQPIVPPQQRLRTTTVRTEEYYVPDAQNPVQGGQVQQESGPENPAPPWNPSDYSTTTQATQPSPATLKEDDAIRDAMANYFSTFARKKQEAEARTEAATPIPAPAEGASPFGEEGMEVVEAANVTPPAKIGMDRGQSGSSGVYRLNAGRPDLEKGFQKMGRTVSTYCKICGVSVDEEGDLEHFRKTKHASFRKI